MPEPALVVCILGLPFLFAVFDLIRTSMSIRNSPNRERGIWSRTLQIGGASAATSVPPATATRRPSTPAPGLR